LKSGVEGEILPPDILSLEACVEPEVCQGNSKPGHKTCNGRHIREPTEYLASASRDGHEGEQREERVEDDRDVG